MMSVYCSCGEFLGGSHPVDMHEVIEMGCLTCRQLHAEPAATGYRHIVIVETSTGAVERVARNDGDYQNAVQRSLYASRYGLREAMDMLDRGHIVQSSQYTMVPVRCAISVKPVEHVEETREVLASVLHRFGHLDTDAGRRECINEVEALLAKLDPAK